MNKMKTTAIRTPKKKQLKKKKRNLKTRKRNRKRRMKLTSMMCFGRTLVKALSWE
jgi:hypothetical protein